MFPDWFPTTGFVIVVGYIGVLLHMRSARPNDVSPREEYERALSDAHAARGQFLREGFLLTTRSLKDRICYNAQRWHIRLCPLCR